MPNCFSLTRKSNPEAGPVLLTVIDEEMCAHFGVVPDEKRYHREWYNIEGLALAMGKDWAWMRENFEADRREIIDWLEANFTTDAWYSPYK